MGAAINVFAWKGFTSLSLLWLHVLEAALLTFTMPIWATLLAWPVLGERPTMRTVVALCLGIAGLLLLVSGNLHGGSNKLPGVVLALTAAVLFAWGSVTFRGSIPLPQVVLTAWLIGLGSSAMVAAALIIETPTLASLTPGGMGALAYLAVGPMALCYLAWFGAIKRLPTATASTGLLLVPIIGTLSAAVILGEPLGMREILAFALTLGGVALVAPPRMTFLVRKSAAHTAPTLRRRSISPGAKPSWPRMLSVSAPSCGAAWQGISSPGQLTGGARRRISPPFGWGTERTRPSSARKVLSSAAATSWTGAAGTCPAKRSSHSAVVRSERTLSSSSVSRARLARRTSKFP